MALFGLLRLGWGERTGFALYGHAVAAARDPALFTEFGVPDTLDGRFDMVALHAALLIRRLRIMRPRGGALAQSVFDAMFSDMDATLREAGAGDKKVGMKMREMWEAFHGRALSYEAALAEADEAALAEALARNVWRGAPAPGQAPALARLTLARDAHLATQRDDALRAGRAAFVPFDARAAGTETEAGMEAGA